jgi:hypothetical protein
MHCDLCGTKVKVVGQRYEPVVDRASVVYKIIMDATEKHFKQVNNDWDKEFAKVSADAIISAMYGEGA